MTPDLPVLTAAYVYINENKGASAVMPLSFMKNERIIVTADAPLCILIILDLCVGFIRRQTVFDPPAPLDQSERRAEDLCHCSLVNLIRIRGKLGFVMGHKSLCKREHFFF